MAESLTLHGLPVFLRLAGRPVILLGDGEAADAKRRLLERAGALVTADEDASAQLAIVAIEDDAAALAAIARLKGRGVLVNAVDRPDQCDFTLPAIVDRAPVIVAIGTGGASAGLAAALRQRLEALLPAGLGRLADQLKAARPALRARFPDPGVRRRALAAAFGPGKSLDPLGPEADVTRWLAGAADAPVSERHVVELYSADPDALTLRVARLLAQADRIYHADDVPAAILSRARADAALLPIEQAAGEDQPGISIVVTMAARP
jgi:uroporphyrin-III C-methyltransferase/precorrin-2 dehydrogenase/sirohydrochlorin ferrochelatase